MGNLNRDFTSSLDCRRPGLYTSQLAHLANAVEMLRVLQFFVQGPESSHICNEIQDQSLIRERAIKWPLTELFIDFNIEKLSSQVFFLTS